MRLYFSIKGKRDKKEENPTGWLDHFPTNFNNHCTWLLSVLGTFVLPMQRTLGYTETFFM